MRFRPIWLLALLMAGILSGAHLVRAEDDIPSDSIFDDRLLLEGYTDKYSIESKDILLAIIQDETVSPFKTAAAVRVFQEQYCREIFSREKTQVERILLRRLNHTDSPFVQVEIMHTLCLMDRYKYFTAMVPALILKMDHYNDAVNERAYAAVNDIIAYGNNRPREARIVFNTLRRVLFLSRRRLAGISEPDQRLTQKFELLRGAMKVLGTQEIRRLPKEVINLL